MTAAAVRLETLSIRDYRNLESLDVTLPANGLAIVGDNGQGKSNLLEAVYYLHILRAARGTRDLDATRFGTDGFSIAATIEQSHGPRGVTVGFERASRRKRVRLDGVVVPRQSDAVGSLPSVMFAPTDVALIAGEPSARRRYLDIVLALTSRAYLASLMQYRAALLRRNAVLRDLQRTGGGGAQGEASVAAWEPALAHHGHALTEARRGWVRAMRSRFAELCAAFGERAPVALRYAPSFEGDDANAAAAALEARRSMDIRRGGTHAGPHRDLIGITADGRDLRTFGSAGQQRSASIALRLVEAETYRDQAGSAPLLLLDDPFAELDADRAARVLDTLRGLGPGQTLLAVPRASEIPPGFDLLPRATMRGGVLTTAEAGP